MWPFGNCRSQTKNRQLNWKHLEFYKLNVQANPSLKTANNVDDGKKTVILLCFRQTVVIYLKFTKRWETCSVTIHQMTSHKTVIDNRIWQQNMRHKAIKGQPVPPYRILSSQKLSFNTNTEFLGKRKVGKPTHASCALQTREASGIECVSRVKIKTDCNTICNVMDKKVVEFYLSRAWGKEKAKFR